MSIEVSDISRFRDSDNIVRCRLCPHAPATGSARLRQRPGAAPCETQSRALTMNRSPQSSSARASQSQSHSQKAACWRGILSHTAFLTVILALTRTSGVALRMDNSLSTACFLASTISHTSIFLRVRPNGQTQVQGTTRPHSMNVHLT